MATCGGKGVVIITSGSKRPETLKTQPQTFGTRFFCLVSIANLIKLQGIVTVHLKQTTEVPYISTPSRKQLHLLLARQRSPRKWPNLLDKKNV